MNFALMSGKIAGVGKTEHFLAVALFANVETIVLIYVFSNQRTWYQRGVEKDIVKEQITITRTSWCMLEEALFVVRHKTPSSLTC